MHLLALVALSLGAADLALGGVERRIVIYSDPPGALVYRNGVPIGQTPVDDHFVYYGKYHFTLVRDKCKTLEVEQQINPPWFQYLGMDFVTENLVPYKFRDVRYLYYRLEPLQPINQQEFVTRAVELRNRSKTIGSAPVQQASVPPVASPAGPAQGQTASRLSAMPTGKNGGNSNPDAPLPFPPVNALPPVGPTPAGSQSMPSGRPVAGGGLGNGPPGSGLPVKPQQNQPSSSSVFVPAAGSLPANGNSGSQENIGKSNPVLLPAIPGSPP